MADVTPVTRRRFGAHAAEYYRVDTQYDDRN